MKSQRNYLWLLLAAVVLVGAWAGLGALESHNSAKEAQRLADIAAAKERAEVAEAAASELEKEADALRLELEHRAATEAASKKRITEHRNRPIDENIDIRDLRDSFVLLGYGLPR